MSREMDIVVLGATGFTGRRVLEYLTQLTEAQNLRMGAAARNRSKLVKILAQGEAINRIEVILTDVTKLAQIKALTQRTKLVLNCIGPYRYTGESVVAACIAAGTDYLDVAGEPEFMERVDMIYQEEAQNSKCFVVSSCGFDSIPADLGTIFVQQKLPVPSSVEAFHSFQTSGNKFRGNYATWESAVQGFGSAENLRNLRKRRRALEKAHAASRPSGPKLQPAQAGTYDARVKAYVVPFPGSDVSVVRRTQKAISSMGEAPVQFAASVCVSSRWQLLILAIFNVIFTTLAAFWLGRNFLLRFSGIFSYGVFSKTPPTQDQVQATSFSTLLIGKGYDSEVAAFSGEPPDREVRVKVSGPDPGYIATPILLVQAAITLLDERDAIAARLGDGGVYTPGTLLYKSSYVQRIQKAGIQIEEISAL